MPRIIKEDIDRWYDCGIYPQTRVIYLGGLSADDLGNDVDFTEDGGITWNTSRRLIKGIHLLDSNGQVICFKQSVSKIQLDHFFWHKERIFRT